MEEGIVEIEFMGEKRKFNGPIKLDAIVSSIAGAVQHYSALDKVTGVEYAMGSTLPPGSYLYKQTSFMSSACHECVLT